jgi:hypothetical protein
MDVTERTRMADIGPGAADIARSAAEGGHAALAAVGLAAAVVRLATYSGPPRPWRAIVLDAVVQALVAFSVAELVQGAWGSTHLAIGAGIVSGLIGWEAVKRVAAARIAAKGG